MSSNHEDEATYRRDYRPGYGPKHHIPTVQQYRSFKDEQKADISANQAEGGTSEDPEPSHKGQGLNRWFAGSRGESQSAEKGHAEHDEGKAVYDDNGVQQGDKPDTSETSSAARDPKARRKELKNRNVDQAERQVTDPVTHLPVTIRDYSDADLKDAVDQTDIDNDTKSEIRDPPAQAHASADKLGPEYASAARDEEGHHQGMEKSFPPPKYEIARHELATVYSKATAIGVGALLALSCLSIGFGVFISSPNIGRTVKYLSFSVATATVTGIAIALTTTLSGWVHSKAKQTWDDSIWETQRLQEKQDMSAPEPESTKWLNKLFGSIWPLVNPDLFASLADTLEDVMQASLPKMVRMVSVEDLGQGSEPLRILGIKWLPHGAASKSVTKDGDKSQRNADGSDKNKGDMGGEGKDGKDEGEDKDGTHGLEAEEGDFINLEMAFAYRSSREIRKGKDREKNAHLYMAFYLPGGVKLPVWVELRGFVGSTRMRLQLTPDPPFIALATFTFLGQPKVDLACTPLFKQGLNLMDVPFISNFVQSAVDAAVNQYVAPKSLILDLKSMISGDDFKHDTFARGVLWIRVHRAFDFKASDMRIPGLRKGSSDPYVSIGWGKFAKPLFSTRVLVDNMEPYWEEETFLTVGPEELNAGETLRLQLWDSDKTTADDDLGRIEVPLKKLMRDERSDGKLWKRVDNFEALKGGEVMPGRLEWSVGYFTKARLMDFQVAHKAPKDGITTVDQLKQDTYRVSKEKLREANRDCSSEADQLMADDWETTSTDMVTSSVPTSTFPSGILSVQIHQIQGLELEKQNAPRDMDGGEPDNAEEETGNHSPDSYCTILINHQRVFKTRTKPKNSKPFFNAGIERFIRDWRSTSVIVSVRDARHHEKHPLLGIVFINLGELLHKRGTSRINDFFPLSGGIGYGRVRISLVFHSVQMQPMPQQLGWEWGTVEVAPEITASEDLPSGLRSCRIKARTALGKGRLHSSRQASKEADGDDTTVWRARKGRPVRVPVRKRYAAPLIFEFRSSRLLLPDQSSAFAILWLKEIPDEEDITLTLPVFRGDIKRAEANVLPEEKYGEKVGSIQVKVRFWRGLGRWHGRLARSNPAVANVMECLVAARDSDLAFHDGLVGDLDWLAKRQDERNQTGEGEDVDGYGSSDTDESDSSDSDEGKEIDGASGEHRRSHGHHDHGNATSSSGGIVDEIKSYKKNKDQLHSRHRGIMQWKGPRTINWLKGKVEHTADSIRDSFHHSNREPGIETEV